MKISADTNVLIRAVAGNDAQQSRAAAGLLRQADVIAISLVCLCEFVRVLRRVYGFGQDDITAAIEALMAAGNIVVERPAVEAGLAVHRAGGDFADGVIAYEGRWLGAETFVSLDRKAVALLTAQGQSARLLE